MNFPPIISKIGFWTKRHSPELLIVGGIISSAAAIGLAIFATTKVDKVLKPYNDKIENIKKDLKDDNKIQNNEIDVKVCKKELALTYGKAALRIAALYTPSVLCFVSSIICTCSSHKIMKARNLALAAAYTISQQSYEAYRNRVKSKLGEKVENELFKDIQKDTVEVIDADTGKVTKKKIGTPHARENNFWNVIYDQGNHCFSNENALANFDFLMFKQAYLNEKLQRQGYLFLWDVYQELGYTTAMLGPEKARASRILGWIYNPVDPKRNSYISFGITEPGTMKALPEIAEQIQKNETAFWLNLNPDGDILSGEYGKEVYSKYAKEGY